MEIYLDNSSTTKPDDKVVDIMLKALTSYYGNPSSLHHKGVESEKLLKQARKQVAKGLESNSEEIVFTSGGTESNNLAIHGALNSKKRKGKGIITTEIEHPSVLNVLRSMEQKGYKVDYLNVDSFGRICIEQLEEYLSEDTILVSVMHVNNEVGTIQPIEEIGKLLKKYEDKPIFHVDAIQSFGKVSFSPKRIGADLLSISGHKIHGPKGVGALYIDKGCRIVPLLLGGNQETGIRSGTENVPGILGLGTAVEIIFDDFENKIEKIRNLKNRFINRIQDEVEDIKVNGMIDKGSAPHIANISFLGVKGEVLLHMLEQDQIYVSTGSACSSKKRTQSHVLKAIGLKDEEIEGAIRFSFSYKNTFEEIDYAVERIKSHVKNLRELLRK
jgi:cysteine desulfurase